MSALQGSGHSFSDIVEAHGSLDVQSLINAAPAYQPNFSADQAPAIDASMLVATVAPTVGMPSAEMLQAVTNVAGVQHGGAVEQVIADAVSGVQQGGAVEQVLAEALGHNNAPTVDGLLQGLPGGGASGEMSAILNGSSANVGAVSGWDMGVHGAFGPTADMLFKMDVSTFHHDAVQPAVNG